MITYLVGGICEILAFMVLVYYVCDKKRKKNFIIYCMITVLFSIAVIYISNFYDMNEFSFALSFLLCLCYVMLLYKEKFIKSIIMSGACMSVVVCLEVLCSLPILVINKQIKEDFYYGSVIAFGVLCIVFLSCKYTGAYQMIQKLIQNKIVIRLLCSIYIMFFCYIIFYFKKIRVFNLLDYAFIIGMAILIIATVLEWYKQYRRYLERKKEVDLYKLYLEPFEELINRMRVRQHEFDNHINAILSMQLTIKTYDELVEKQRKYIESLYTNMQIESLELFQISDRVLAGFLFSKILQATDKNIEVNIEIKQISLHTKAKETDIIEIVGTLLNNAIEESMEKGKIIFILNSVEDRLIISVLNRHEKIMISQLDKFFLKGYSTKEKEGKRGYGLYNLKKLIELYKGEIMVSNICIEKENYILFKVKF